MFDSVKEAIDTVYEMAVDASVDFANTKEITSTDRGTVTTIRVPVSLLKRIMDMREIAKESALA